MTNPTVQRIIIIGSVILSALTIFLCAAGILVTWLANFALGSLVVDLSLGVEKTAQTLQRGVTRMETGVTNLKTELQSISQATNQISQNIADQGLVRTLLPAEREQRLDLLSERLTTTFDAIGDATSSARDLYRAINRIPGVNLPTPPEDSVTRMNESVTQIRGDVQDLKAGIQRVRGGAANTVNQLAEVVDRVSARLDTLLSQLNSFNAALTGVQTASQQARRTIPTLLTIIAVILTLIAIWVIYTQVLVLRINWAKWRSPEPLTAPPEPAIMAPTIASPERASSIPVPPAADAPPAPSADVLPSPAAQTRPPPHDL